MHRRSLLSAFLVSITVGAGCLDQHDDQVRLASLSLWNRHQERHSAEVKIEDSGELVFSDTFQLHPEADDANIILQDPVDGSGRYVVSVRIAGQSQEVDLLEQVTPEQDCPGVQFTIAGDGTLDFSIESPNEC